MKWLTASLGDHEFPNSSKCVCSSFQSRDMQNYKMLSLGLQEHFYDLFGTLYSRSNLITFQKHFLSFFSWNWILLILMYPSDETFWSHFQTLCSTYKGPYHDKNRSRQTVLLPKFLEPEIGWTLAFLKWLASWAATWRAETSNWAGLNMQSWQLPAEREREAQKLFTNKHFLTQYFSRISYPTFFLLELHNMSE